MPRLRVAWRLFLACIGAFLALPFELLVGLRYTRAKRRNHFISFISLISMLGVALGVAALIVVLSVMNGFQKEIRTRLLGVASHVVISAYEEGLPEWQQVEQAARGHARVKEAAPFVEGEALLVHESQVKGALIRGVLPQEEDKVASFRQFMKMGRFDDLMPGEFRIILGIDLAAMLGVTMGDYVTVIAPQGLVTPAGMVPRTKRFLVAGIFSAGTKEPDTALALIHMQDAQKLYNLGDNVSGVRLKLDDLFAARSVTDELRQQMPLLRVVDWTRMNANYFRAVQIEKTMMFIILSLIVAVAAFNIVSTLVMAVTDKESDIAILRTLGASPGSITLIFIIQGALIGFFGLALGVIGGVSLALNIDVVVPAIERTLGFQFLSKDVFYIPDLPSDLHWDDVYLITGISFLLTLVATIIPSRRAAKINPAEALRYE